MNNEDQEAGGAGNIPSETIASVKSIAVNLSFKFLAFLAAFFFQVYYARVLGPKNLGDISLAMSVFAFALVPAVMGLDTGLTRFLPQFRGKQDFVERLALQLGYALRMSTAVSVCVIGIVVLLRHQLSRAVSPAADISFYILFLSPLILLTVWNSLLGGALRAWERFHAYSFASDFIPRFSLGAVFTASYLATGRDLFSYLLGMVVAPLLQLGAITKSLGGRVLRTALGPIVKLETQERRSLVVFGLKTLLYSFLVSGMAQTARLMLGYFGKNAGVGIYAVVESLSAILIFFQASFGTVFTPQIARLHHAGQRGALVAVYGRLSRWALLAGLPFTILVLLDSREVMAMYGAQYSEGRVALLILVAAQAAVVFLGLNANMLYMTGRENLIVVGQVLCLGISVAAAAVLIPRYGLLGAALAVGGASVLMNLAFMILVRKLFGVMQFSVDTLRTLLAGVVLGLLLHGLVVPLEFGHAVLGVLVKLGISYTLFLAVVLVIDRRPEDVEVLGAAWTKLRAMGLGVS